MRIQFLCLKDAMEKEMATHSSIFAGRMPWIKEPVELGSQSQTQLKQPSTHT